MKGCTEWLCGCLGQCVSQVMLCAVSISMQYRYDTVNIQVISIRGIKHTDNTETHTGQCHVARRQVLCQHLHGYFFKTEIIPVEYVFTKNSQSL